MSYIHTYNSDNEKKTMTETTSSFMISPLPTFLKNAYNKSIINPKPSGKVLKLYERNIRFIYSFLQQNLNIKCFLLAFYFLFMIRIK